MIPAVQAIVDQIAVERERFERFCFSLSAEELQRPVPGSTWQVKDFASHLATIDRPMIGWFSALQSGETGRPSGAGGVVWDVDRYNDAAVIERRTRDLPQIFAEAGEVRAELVAVLGRFTEEQVGGTIRFGGDSKRPPSDIRLLRYLQGWARHDVIHSADMLKALPERRDDGVIVEWFAEPGVREIVGYYQAAMQ